MIHIHGLADETFPFNGGPGKRNNGGTGSNPADTSGAPIPQMIGTWQTVDQCAAPVSHASGAVTTSIANCPDGRSVELITIAGAGHQWPGAPGTEGTGGITTRPAVHGPGCDLDDLELLPGPSEGELIRHW